MADIYLLVDGVHKGPYVPGQLQPLIAMGTISGETPAWCEGLEEWMTLESLLAALSEEPEETGQVEHPAEIEQPEEIEQAAPPPAAEDEWPAPPPLPGINWKLIGMIAAGVVALALVGLLLLLGPLGSAMKIANQNATVQTTRQIELAMFQYAIDHKGAYPDGKNSTEVFQKLIDQGYVADPAIFFLPMKGKSKPDSRALTADNVCFDVTAGVTADASDAVPMVFCTGYTVKYEASSAATRDGSSATPFSGPGKQFTGVAVAYKSNQARFIRAGGDGSIADFVPANFDAGGKTYRQLKP